MLFQGEDNTFLSSNICQVCQQPCKTCTSLNSCTSCIEGYCMDSNNTCQVCSSDCNTCMNNNTKCTSCKVGYYLKDDRCFECDSNCIECTSFNDCIKCKSPAISNIKHNCELQKLVLILNVLNVILKIHVKLVQYLNLQIIIIAQFVMIIVNHVNSMLKHVLLVEMDHIQIYLLILVMNAIYHVRLVNNQVVIVYNVQIIITYHLIIFVRSVIQIVNLVNYQKIIVQVVNLINIYKMQNVDYVQNKWMDVKVVLISKVVQIVLKVYYQGIENSCIKCPSECQVSNSSTNCSECSFTSYQYNSTTSNK
ncbi:unnamed protein product [Paramecium sonneborni]|uniref:Uncharacterized protein n=1 Tax=Paramecium sonneborni TaxID=65129 RepID=A0A8S1RFR8_9CILI|nr:unnamed protein product [Paramecium sonneborni]